MGGLEEGGGKWRVWSRRSDGEGEGRREEEGEEAGGIKSEERGGEEGSADESAPTPVPPKAHLDVPTRSRARTRSPVDVHAPLLHAD